jgi:5-hydroxyisourate hydrolase
VSGLTTHVLDLAAGRPAADVRVRLSRLTGPGELAPVEIATDGDGRARLLHLSQLAAGLYRLEFGVGAYFRRTGAALAEPGFLETVAIEFNLPEQTVSHHVPLLVSPFGYSTYRGS